MGRHIDCLLILFVFNHQNLEVIVGISVLLLIFPVAALAALPRSGTTRSEDHLDSLWLSLQLSTPFPVPAGVLVGGIGSLMSHMLWTFPLRGVLALDSLPVFVYCLVHLG